MSNFLLHTLFLLTAVIVAFLWTSDPNLSFYTLQLIAVLLLFFFLNQFLAKRKQSKINRTIDAVIFTLVVLLLVTSSGGLSSPLFFLIYFLMFGLSLLFEPLITFSLAAAIGLLFFLTTTPTNILAELIQLFSLLLITPLALFFGHQYLKVLEDEERIKILEEEEKISQEELAQEEKDVLLWTSLEFKKGLAMILDQVSQMLADISHLTETQKDRLYKIRGQILRLLKSGEELKEKVENREEI